MSQSPLRNTPFFDVVVAGAGLGGLSAALNLLRKGFTVAVVEQAARVGGLCGTHRIDGREYVIACNDFGSAMPGWLEQLGVKVRFKRYRTCVFYEGRRFHLPPTVTDVLRLLPHAADLRRYLRALKASKESQYATERTLAELVARNVKHRMIADLLQLPAYLMGVSPQQLRIDALSGEADFGYGYLQPTVPEGGPQALVNEMAAKVLETGMLLLGTRFLGFHTDLDGDKVVHTSRGSLRCRYLVKAIPEDPYPNEFPRGLPLSMYCLAVSPPYRYPPRVHTHVYYPSGVDRWFGALERGQLPAEFGFHVFNSHLVASAGEYTVNVYFYLPRGMNAPDARMRGKVERYLLARLGRMLPGLPQAIRERHFLSPQDFEARHSMSSRVLPVITPAGYAKPENYCSKSDTYHAGAAFYPPGDHAGAAVLSGRFVAERIARARSEGKVVEIRRERKNYESRSA